MSSSAYAHEIKFDAERRMGEMLAEAPKNRGTAGAGRPSLGAAQVEVPKDTAPTYHQVGIDYKTASRAQQLAHMPAELFEQVKTGAKGAGAGAGISPSRNP
jgi:hypothetical protein